MSYCKQKCMPLKKVDRTVDATVEYIYLTRLLLLLLLLSIFQNDKVVQKDKPANALPQLNIHTVTLNAHEYNN